jgi:hypothetical protein
MRSERAVGIPILGDQLRALRILRVARDAEGTAAVRRYRTCHTLLLVHTGMPGNPSGSPASVEFAYMNEEKTTQEISDAQRRAVVARQNGRIGHIHTYL